MTVKKHKLIDMLHNDQIMDEIMKEVDEAQNQILADAIKILDHIPDTQKESNYD